MNANLKQGEMGLENAELKDVPSRGIGRWATRSVGMRPSVTADAKGQLSLEFVRVVRNDLSDADLELVPVKTPVPSSAAVEATPGCEPLPEGDELEPEASRWSRFRARLFGAGTPG